MGEVGKSQVRVDAFDKATGRTKYYEDLMPRNALYVRIKHAEIAHGFVKSVDTSAAEAIDGVVKVITCFDVPDITFPTAGHPWSMDPGHQDVVTFEQLGVDRLFVDESHFYKNRAKRCA